MKVYKNKNNMVVIGDNNEKILFSYETEICKYNEEKQVLTLNGEWWNFSKNTAKHFKEFLNTYTNKIYETKKQFEKEIKFDTTIEQEDGEEKKAFLGLAKKYETAEDLDGAILSGIQSLVDLGWLNETQEKYIEKNFSKFFEEFQKRKEA